MANDVIILLDEVETEEQDEYGDKLVKPVMKEIFAEVLSVGMQEFYQAQAEGYKPEIRFLISDYLEYDNQEYIIYGDFKYKVLRNYRKGNGLEITCYGGVRNASATISSKD